MAKNTTYSWIYNQCASNPKDSREDIELSDVFITLGELNEFLTDAISKNPDVKDFKLCVVDGGSILKIASIIISFKDKAIYVKQ